MNINELPFELRFLIHTVTEMWGDVVRSEGGSELFKKVEALRQAVKPFRSVADVQKELGRLTGLFKKMSHLKGSELEDVTHAFAVLLELINQCENAVRSEKIRQKRSLTDKKRNVYLEQEIYLVLTAHPTESRSPDVVTTLQSIQSILARVLLEKKLSYLSELEPYLKKMWALRLGRVEIPEVSDEADFIYSLVFRKDVLKVILNSQQKIFLRTWVGGDKDGHPGVDENVMLDSLQRSRSRLLGFLNELLEDSRLSLGTDFSSLRKANPDAVKLALRQLSEIAKQLKDLERIQAGDTQRVGQLQIALSGWKASLPEALATQMPSLNRIMRLFEVFPYLVLPLELRESSEVFRAGEKSPAILRMLKKLHEISGGTDPRGYARGLIISMTESIEDLRNAYRMLKSVFDAVDTFPVIPLFERTEDLERGPEISRQWIRERKLKKFEVMVGYSDSSKEAGVLPSRLAIQKALGGFEKIQEETPGLNITYFHGSGGSIDRGGGKIEDQTSYWPVTALKRYKATLQGEMIQRTFSTPEIFEQYLEKINDVGLKRKNSKTVRPNKTLETFANSISEFYRQSISDPRFLNMIEEASAYRFIGDLHFGSRPSKRKKLEGISSLRAIPWILSWTQTRILLPTWWGVGTAYKNLKHAERQALKKAMRGTAEPMFKSFVSQLGFTLAKVEMPIWLLYLKHSSLSESDKKFFTELFMNEFALTVKAIHEITGKKDLLWFRPWLKESIRLRAPLIHPLNIAQILAWEQKNSSLLRDAAVGIASGMLTTG